MYCAFTFVYPSVSIHPLSSLRVRPNRPQHSLFSSIPASGDSLTDSQINASANTRRHRSGTRYRYPRDGSPESDEIISFEHAVALFNSGDYYRCHDVLEELWYDAEEPTRTIIHGILQCAVGFHHLFKQNHRGAMMELGEGLCKLRKMGFESGPFLRFEQEVSEALEFVYQTQKELAACADDLCITMDGSEISYRLLGSFAAGQDLYRINHTPEGSSVIVFTSNNSSSMIKVPTLDADDMHLEAFQYRGR